MTNSRQLARSTLRFAVIGALAFSLVACGGRFGRPDDVGTSGGQGPTAGPRATPAEGPTSRPSASPAAASESSVATTPTPTLDLPDLTVIDPYITDLDAVFGNEATATTDEGSDQ